MYASMIECDTYINSMKFGSDKYWWVVKKMHYIEQTAVIFLLFTST